MSFRSTDGHWRLRPDSHPFQEQDGRKVEQIMCYLLKVKAKNLYWESLVSPVQNSHPREILCESQWNCRSSLLKQLYILAWPHSSDALKGVDSISGLSVVLLLRAVSQPPEKNTAVVAWAQFIAFLCLRNMGHKEFSRGMEERAFAWLGFCLVMRNSWSLLERAWLQQACAHGNDWHLHPGQVLGSLDKYMAGE